MDKIYHLCQFEYGGTGNFYQEVENGIVKRLVNLDGSTLEITEPYGYIIIDKEGYVNLTFPQGL